MLECRVAQILAHALKFRCANVTQKKLQNEKKFRHCPRDKSVHRRLLMHSSLLTPPYAAPWQHPPHHPDSTLHSPLHNTLRSSLHSALHCTAPGTPCTTPPYTTPPCIAPWPHFATARKQLWPDLGQQPAQHHGHRSTAPSVAARWLDLATAARHLCTASWPDFATARCSSLNRTLLVVFRIPSTKLSRNALMWRNCHRWRVPHRVPHLIWGIRRSAHPGTGVPRVWKHGEVEASGEEIILADNNTWCIHNTMQDPLIRLNGLASGQPYGQLKHSTIELVHNCTVPEQRKVKRPHL